MNTTQGTVVVTGIGVTTPLGGDTASTWDGAARRLRVTFRQDHTDATPTEIVVPAALYPDGIDVTTSLGDAGGVDQSWDEGQGVVVVSLQRGSGDRAICVAPAGAGTACPAAAPVDPPDATPPPAAPAAPVAAPARFTG